MGYNHHISYSESGLSLSLDIPNNKRNFNFITMLNTIINKYNFKRNIAKDSSIRIKKCYFSKKRFRVLKKFLIKSTKIQNLYLGCLKD